MDLKYREGKYGNGDGNDLKDGKGIKDKKERKIGKTGTVDFDELKWREAREKLDSLPDMIDIRLLMSSRDELRLPKEELFTQNDLRQLIIFPYIFPLVEYFAFFFFNGIIRLIAITRQDILRSSPRSHRLEHDLRHHLHLRLPAHRPARPRDLRQSQHQALQLHHLHPR